MTTAAETPGSEFDLGDAIFYIDAGVRRELEGYELGGATSLDPSEDETHIRRWGLTLLAEDIDEKEVIVGQADFVHFEGATVREDFYELMDAVDGDLEWIAGQLCDPETGAMRDDMMTPDSSDLWIVDRVTIQAPYRGHRLSHLLVHEGLRLVQSRGYVALVPMPQEGPRTKAGIRRMGKHWRRAGFSPTPGTDGTVWGAFASDGYLFR